MPKIGVNLNAVESNQPVPDGTYILEILETSKIRQSKSSGQPLIGWRCLILEGELEGQKVYFETSLSPNALWKMKAFAEVLGISWDDDGFDLEDTFGLHFSVDLFTRSYEGRDFQDSNNFGSIKKKGRSRK